RGTRTDAGDLRPVLSSSRGLVDEESRLLPFFFRRFLCLWLFGFFPQAHRLTNPITASTDRPYTPATTSSNMIPQPRGNRSACRAGKGFTISNARNKRKPPSSHFHVAWGSSRKVIIWPTTSSTT